MLSTVWDRPGNGDADGEIAAFLRYATVFLEQTKLMTAQKIGILTGKTMRVGVLGV